MSVASEIARIKEAIVTIRAKFVELGISQTTDKVEDLAEDSKLIVNQGSVSATVKEGDTYTIPKGYHNGSGTVSGIAGGGNYSLQSRTVTPTTAEQNITPDSGYYGLSDVTVSPIPINYKDVSITTAEAENVLSGKTFVSKTGVTVTGTMPNHSTGTPEGSVYVHALSVNSPSYTIPKGYHDGTAVVSILLDQKTVIPTKESQRVSLPGGALSSVIVEPIPDNFIDTTDATATAEQILAGSTAYVNGSKVSGSMVNNGAMTKTIDGLTISSVVIPAGYTSGGVVSLTSDIEAALAEI